MGFKNAKKLELSKYSYGKTIKSQRICYYGTLLFSTDCEAKKKVFLVKKITKTVSTYICTGLRVLQEKKKKKFFCSVH